MIFKHFEGDGEGNDERGVRVEQEGVKYKGRNSPDNDAFIMIKNEQNTSYESSRKSQKVKDQTISISRINLYKNPEEYDKLLRKEVRKKRRLMKKRNNISKTQDKVCFSKHGFSRIQDKELVDIFLKKKRKRSKNRSEGRTPVLVVHTPGAYRPDIRKSSNVPLESSIEKSSETVRAVSIKKVKPPVLKINKNLDLPKITSKTPNRVYKAKQESLDSPPRNIVVPKQQFRAKSKTLFKKKISLGSYRKDPSPRKYTDLLTFNFQKELTHIEKALDEDIDSRKRVVQFQLPPI